MTQVAQPVGPMARSWESGIVTAFASHIVNGIEHNASNREVVETVLRIQKDLRAVCCQCGKKWPVTFISRSYARRVCNLARSVAFHELMQELGRRLNGHIPQCPRCGRAGDDPGRETVN